MGTAPCEPLGCATWRPHLLIVATLAAPPPACNALVSRWEAFRAAYLTTGTKSPIGKITRFWGRFEDQARASLHVHSAIWVEGDESHDDASGPMDGIKAITCEAPRNSSSPAGDAWRNAVLRWQTHRCYPLKCNMKNGQPIDYCRYDYPRPRTDIGVTPAYTVHPSSGRYTYPCTQPEDENLSPYVPEWLLAYGAAMNVMYVDGGSFLSYIAKYVTKAEPSGSVLQPDIVRNHNGCLSRQLRYLTSRLVGAPEAVAIGLGHPMAYTTSCTTLSTQLPHKRKRALKQLKDRREDDWNIWADGWREKYAARPRDLEFVLFPDFVRLYDVKRLGELSKAELQRERSPCLVHPTENVRRERATRNAAEEARHATLVQIAQARLLQRPAGAVYEDSHFDPDDASFVAVRRAAPRHIFYRMPLPHKDGTHAFCYHLLLLRTPWRSDLPSSFIEPGRNQSRTLHEETALRKLLGPSDNMEDAVRSEAERRRFSPKDIDVMAKGGAEYDELSRVLRGTYADYGSDEEADEDNLDGDVDVSDAYFDSLAAAGQPAPPRTAADVDDAEEWEHADDDDVLLGGVRSPPDVDEEEDEDGSARYVWWESRTTGAARVFNLTGDQSDAFRLLKDAPCTKALWTFLSGVGGTGKSTVLRLLIHYWRSQGLRVLVMAPTAFAAKQVR